MQQMDKFGRPYSRTIDFTWPFDVASGFFYAARSSFVVPRHRAYIYRSMSGLKLQGIGREVGQKAKASACGMVLTRKGHRNSGLCCADDRVVGTFRLASYYS